ncbi:unnamed protein product [Candidula unifasciata]|uniref:Uncharacterized protein n=1 Tax=Candidula unifasciata TaxID=100452 RepID=A0A8S4A7L7_9EUPU|nr:unnamed protein product [Candidula unifasciata]
MSLRDLSLVDTTVISVSNETSTAISNQHGKDNHVLLFILLPATAVVFVGIAIGLIVWMLKRSRLDKLRHHLMPLYSFENSDSGQDLETDLLSQDVHLRDSTSPPNSPILKLNTMYSEL